MAKHHIHAQRHTQRDTHTQASEINGPAPQVTFPFTEISTDSSPSTPRDSPLLACSLGETEKMIGN